MEDKRELHSTRLGTTDEKGHRVMPQPEDVQGKWKRRRSWFYSLLILFYLVLPWIRVNGKQWVLLDIPKREFTLFGTMFHAYDGVYLIFVLVGFMLAVAFVTSVWGRVWCGWACPQTVFIDHVYRKIERWVQGNGRKRKALRRAPLSFEKMWKLGLTWFLFLIVSLHIVHSFLGYFVGTRELVAISFQSPWENWTLFVTMLVLTGIVLFDFGWFREQFCVIACPYGRFQSVLMDENSLAVAYDEKRGEPRRRKGLPKEQEGDCINCFKCVKVCPTGIDIRRGANQMECIACTMCVDACDEIMRKVGKPEGLIRYSSEAEMSGKKRRVGARSVVYAVLVVGVLIGAAQGLSLRKELKAQFLRMPGEPFSASMVDGEKIFINRFEAKAQVIGRQGMTVNFRVAPSHSGDVELVSAQLPREIRGDKETVHLFFKFGKNQLEKGKSALPVIMEVLKDGEVVEEMKTEVGLVGPL